LLSSTAVSLLRIVQMNSSMDKFVGTGCITLWLWFYSM